MKNLGKVLDCGIGTKTRNSKGRVTGYNSMIITFESAGAVNMRDYVGMNLNNELRSFQVHAINIGDNSMLEIEAHEVGYYAHLLDNIKGFDIRTLISLDVFLIEDKEIQAKIYKESCYC